MIHKAKSLPAFNCLLHFTCSIALAAILFVLPNNFASAADSKLTNQKAYQAVWQFLKGHTDKVQVTGVLEVPQQNIAQVDLVISNWLLARPKNDAVTAYAFGPGGGTFNWSGRGKAIFAHYNDGRWVLTQLITEVGTWNDLNIDAESLPADAKQGDQGMAGIMSTQKSKASSTSDVPQGATQTGPRNQLCQIIDNGRRSMAVASQQFNNERNPLKKDAIQGEYQQRQNQLNSTVADFVSNNTINNYTGMVSYMDLKHYNTGPGLNLGIALPCNVIIAIQFIEITNPGWGGIDPQSQTPLPPWKPVLENLAVGDAVTFSGRFFLRYGPPGVGDEKQPSTLEAVITSLSKGTKPVPETNVFNKKVTGGSQVKTPPQVAVEKPVPESVTKGEGSALSTTRETSRDGRFIAYNNGTVLDTQTNLMWAAKDNGSSINWASAKSYCENYQGGGYTDWRMPTQDEVAGLYDKTKSYKTACGTDAHLTGLIHLSCFDSWAYETKGNGAAYFAFSNGGKFWNSQSYDNFTRALPVRSGK